MEKWELGSLPVFAIKGLASLHRTERRVVVTCSSTAAPCREHPSTPLQEGQRVSFDEEPDPRDASRQRAVNVRAIEARDAD